jgi:hypothetical protein
MNLIQKLFTLGVAVATLSACTKSDAPTPSEAPAKPTGEVEVYITPMVGSNPFRMNEPFLTPAGEQLTIRDWKFYVSDVALAKATSQEVKAQPVMGDSCQSGVWLVDFNKATHEGSVPGVRNAFMFKFKADTGNFVDLRLAVAVPREYNQADITTNPIPLNNRAGMYWSWNSGFKFFVINGSTPVSPVPVHLSIGISSRVVNYNFRAMLLAINRPRIIVTPQGVTKVYLNYDLNNFFTNTDGSNYSFVQQPGKPTPLQVHGGYWSDILKANSANAMEMSRFVNAN